MRGRYEEGNALRVLGSARGSLFLEEKGEREGLEKADQAQEDTTQDLPSASPRGPRKRGGGWLKEALLAGVSG